jgi:glycosyltransferase involved in cell wall biosynthesis
LRVGYLGRLCPTKGIELLLESIRDAARTQLFIAGKGEAAYEAALRQQANRRTTFLGVVPPRALFEKIDVLVAPSLWHEPFGRIAIEALAWGVPVIASRRGGLPEILEHGGTGFLFEPNEPGSLAWLLRGLTPDACAAMRKACLRRALDFLPETMTSQYEEIYGDVIARATNPAKTKAAVRPGAADDVLATITADAGAAETASASCPASMADV